MTTEVEHWHNVQEMMRGYRTAQVLITCTRFGIFDALAAGPQTAELLAGELKVNSYSLARLLNAAAAFDLLHKEGDSFTNSELATSCLTEDSPYRISNMVRREYAFYQRWGWLDEAVRTGKRPEANIRDEGARDWVWDFEMALYDTARVNGPLVAEALNLPTDRPLRVLDVGGGHGGYSMALAHRYPNVEATVFELPAAAAVARRIIEQAGMRERVAVQEGNFQQESLGKEYDLLLLFGVLLSETPAGKLALLRKSYDALKPGGQVAIRSFWLNADRAGPAESTLASLHMLLSTEAGDISTAEEMFHDLNESGFHHVTKVILPQGVGSLLTAQKPAT